MLNRIFNKLRNLVCANLPGRLLHCNAIALPWEEDVITRILVAKPKVVWDVGAHVGRHAVRLARAGIQVVCFEPNLLNLQYLAHNTREFDNILVVPLALTREGTPMRGNISPDFNTKPTGPIVPTISFEEALKRFSRPDLIKVDIEGGEYELLQAPGFSEFPVMLEVHYGPVMQSMLFAKEAPATSQWNTRAHLGDSHVLLWPHSTATQ